jgi:hypothetical protein
MWWWRCCVNIKGIKKESFFVCVEFLIFNLEELEVMFDSTPSNPKNKKLFSQIQNQNSKTKNFN